MSLSLLKRSYGVTSLTTNGNALPSVFLANTAYTLTVDIDGKAPIFTQWVLLLGDTVVDYGSDRTFTIRIENPGTYTLNVKALRSSGIGEETLTTLYVSSRRTTSPSISVKWDSLQVEAGQPTSAIVSYNDPEGALASSLSWVLYHNNVAQASGSSTKIGISVAQYGIYRILAVATDSTGMTVQADSTLRVSGQYEVLPAIVPPRGEVTLHYLGCLYSDTFTTQASTATSLPYEVAVFLQDTVLLPGTTHIRFVLDGTVDDEVVVRTSLGNWTLVGPPSGLTSELLVYDYSVEKPYLPAPADKRLRYTLDVWNVHGFSVSESKFRVKVECYCSTDPVHEYNRCSYSEFVGGAGERQKRLVAVVENLDVDLDAVYKNNQSVDYGTLTFTTQIPLRIPATASAQGSPYPQLPATGAMYTEANTVAVYDAPTSYGVQPLIAKGVYGISSFRPYAFTLSVPGEEPIVHRVRRAYGTLAVYIAAGGVNAGSTITARIKKNALPGYVDYVIALSDVYNPDTNVYEKIGEVEIDVSDYGFDVGGLAIQLTINE